MTKVPGMSDDEDYYNGMQIMRRSNCSGGEAIHVAIICGNISLNNSMSVVEKYLCLNENIQSGFKLTLTSAPSKKGQSCHEGRHSNCGVNFDFICIIYS